MTSLDILCFNPFHLKNKMMKIGHKKISCGLSKISKNVSWPINICLKCFMAPPKKILCLPPTYLMCGPLLEDNLNLTLLKKNAKQNQWTDFYDQVKESSAHVFYIHSSNLLFSTLSFCLLPPAWNIKFIGAISLKITRIHNIPLFLIVRF